MSSKRHFSWLSLAMYCFLALPSSALPTEEDMRLILERRREEVMRSYNNPSLALELRDSLIPPGVWTDVDYTTGCPARRANWPAQDHFHKIITMASYWAQNPTDTDMRNKISAAMNYWFDNDYPNYDCINAGGSDNYNCPCGTPGFWNTNWYCQMILMPTLISMACLVLHDSLTPTQYGNCTEQIARSYARVDGDPNGSWGPQTGANMLDISSNAVTLALLSKDPELLDEAHGRYFDECQITSGGQDGIKVDGTFFQHQRQIYNGNYGGVFMSAMLRLFMHTENTTIVPPVSTQEAFLTVIEGSEWFMFVRDAERKLIWQYPVIGRMVSHKHEDWHGVGLNLNQIVEGTKTWANHAKFVEIVDRLRNVDAVNDMGTLVNAGPLLGTKFFHTSDYLVHRAQNYIVVLKMFSTRTANSECNNAQNPFGFHLSDGTIYTFLDGSEYVNVYGSWDWNLIPGTTTDYRATPLNCGQVTYTGRERFVGGVTNGHAAVAVMNYTNPLTGSLSWGKAFFFFPGAYVVQFVGDVIPRNASAPVITTLDQRQLAGSVFVDGGLVDSEIINTNVQSVWHDRVGYTFLNSLANVTIDTRVRPTNWSAIGISDGFEPQILFSATVHHPAGVHNADHLAYIAYLDIDQSLFEQVARTGGRTKTAATEPIQLLSSAQSGALSSRADPLVVVRGATYGSSSGNGERLIGLAFWEPGYYATGLDDVVAVDVDIPVLILLRRKPDGAGWTMAVSDPTQTETQAKVTVSTAQGGVTEIPVELPGAPWAGSTVIVEF